jgi:MFS family permease
VSRLRASARRDGAGQSGLASLIELSFVNGAGDGLVAVALAGSLFFAVPTGEARSKVALYLLITMVPFALLAPVVGPLLDRVAYGRRTALAALCLGRGLLAWQLAGALDSLQVYPLALGLLVGSRGFGVARSAVIPRVTPRELTLVQVNSRISLVNIAAGAAVAPVGLGIAQIPYVGYPWVLRICAIVYMAGVLFAFNLPKHVDSAAGELRPHDPAPAPPSRRMIRARVQALGTRVRAMLKAMPATFRAALVLRGLVGFLTFYLAFLLRTEGGNHLWWLGGLAIAAGAGSGLGVFVGGQLGRRRPEGIIMLALLMAVGACVGAAINYSRLTSLVAALLATTAGSMSKLALDATIQRDVAGDTRNSVFAQSETALQLAWVAGGALGLVEMPGVLGFALAAAAVAATLVVDTRALRNARTGRASSSAGRGSTRAQGPTATGYTGYTGYSGYNRPLSAAYEVPPTRPDPTAAPTDADIGANAGPDPDPDPDMDAT